MPESFTDTLALHIKAGYPLLQINSPEETRAQMEIRHAGWMMGDGNKIHLRDHERNIMQAIFLQAGPEYQHLIDANSDMVVPVAKLTRLHVKFTLDNNESADVLAAILDKIGYPMISYDTVMGFSDAADIPTDDNKAKDAPARKALIEARACYDDIYGALSMLPAPDRFPKFCIFVFKDIHNHLNDAQDPRFRRMLRNLFEQNALTGGEIRRPLILLQPDWTPHVDIRHCMTPIDFVLPDEAQLNHEIDFILGAPGFSDKPEVWPKPDVRYAMVRAMRGFTQTEASNTVYMCGTKYKGFPMAVIKMIHRQKAATFRNDDILEYVDEDTLTDSSQIGGYEIYMEYVDECIECYSPEAIKMGIKRPKGVLLLGIPGTGKSMVAMATAKKMGLPLIKFDFGAVFAGVVGESEARMRLALRRIVAQGPCVLLLDEADKAFGGIVGSNNDGGVGQRVFGRLLSWMANENQEAFVIMTMNRLVDPNTGAVIVPVETIRAGRLDTIWYTDFPNKVEREEILAIHMAKNGADWLALHEADRAELIVATDKYVGSELEQICIKAVRTAWKERKVVQPTYEEVAQARKLVSPVAVMDEINIKKINDFCRDRAIPVSRVKATPKPVGPSRRSVDFNASDN